MSLLNHHQERMYFITFTADLKAFAAKTNQNVTDVIKEVAIDICTEVIHKTPVGDPSLWKSSPPANYVPGRLKGNWQATFGSPSSYQLSIKDESGGATIEKMKSVITRWDGINPIYFANNLPYAEIIEYGAHSTQAPQGMVRISIAQFQHIFTKAVAKVAA